MNKVIMITGGQRSGKSLAAEAMALALSDSPVYVATAQVMDDDFARRVAKHQARRGSQWTTIEEPVSLSRVIPSGRVVLIDCVTLWATNCLFQAAEDVDAALAMMRHELSQLDVLVDDTTMIFVTNEVGLGGISADSLMRKFADLQGSINQLIAARADEVYMVISGIKVKIK